LAVSFRPFYLPREFGQVFVTVVYIPPDANTKTACDIIHETTQKLEEYSTDSPKFILGDFNACTLTDSLPNYYQYVKCPTRSTRTIDLCYGNIKDAYKSMARAPIGGSDHNSIYLIPTYRQKLKTVKPTVKSIKVWTTDSLETLKGCFECTDWSIFEGVTLDEMTETITGYITFCVETVVPSKTVKIYPNNKPWITKELKLFLNEKKRAFCEGDKTKVKAVQQKIAAQTTKCKRQYKEKIEKQFSENDLRHAWSGVKAMIGSTKKHQRIETDNNLNFANDLNSFYSRFDCHDFSQDRQKVLDGLENNVSLTITKRDVIKSFNKIKIHKACGPDGLLGIVIKECREQLADVFMRLYQISLDTHVVPLMWKMSNIIPIPKKPRPATLNDYRPVALTSIAMKCFERIIKSMLLKESQHLLDCLQFAYIPKRGVDDATLILLQNIYSHLDRPSSYARLLFVDFSSAFNTIQPYLLLKKLQDMKVNTSIIKWIDSFMLKRQQYVTVNGTRSSILNISTGAPQGCVISPILFIFYTNDCFCSENDCVMIKFADDTVIAGLIKSCEDNYRKAISDLVKWCDSNFLYLNAKKTKELIIDFRKSRANIEPVSVKSEEIERVDQYKYLGTIIDSQLNWKSNTEYIYKKGQQRLHFLRCLRQFGVDKSIMVLFFKTFVLPILCFNFLCWFCSLSVQSKNKLCKIVHIASKIIGSNLHTLNEVFEKQALRKVEKVMNDESHKLHECYSLLPSGRRLRSMAAKTNRSRNSFVHSSIRLYNSHTNVML
jgi:hypothetical protein